MAYRSYDYTNFDKNSKSKSKNNSVFAWLGIIFLLWSLPPVGFLLLFRKLFGNTRKAARGRHPMDIQAEQHLGARIVSTTGERPKESSGVTAPANAKKTKDPGRTMTTVGAVLSAVFGFVSIVTLVDYLWVLPDVVWLLEEMIAPLCFLGGSLGLMWSGMRKQKRARRFRKYLSLIGKRKTISISALAEAMPAAPATVRRDLEDMLDEGYFPAGFLDYGDDELVLTADGLRDETPTPPPAPAPTPKEENAILAEIRALNRAISHPALSAQIDRIEEITAKIFDYQKDHPEKSSQLHSFLSYYLPTTLKILHAYARLESQGVEGENITAAKKRIEDMMSKVVDGFEKQLDQLFQADAMDITSDVAVLERMLSKDGLSGEGLRLGL